MFMEGKNVNLLALNINHIELYQKWRNNPKVRKYNPTYFPLTIENIKSWFDVKEGLQDKINFEIWHKIDNIPIGLIGFMDINWISRNGVIYIIIGEPDYWGKGIATESHKLLIKYGFNDLNFHRILAYINANNKASIRAIEKAGLVYECQLKQITYINGQYDDVNIYGLLKNIFKIKKEGKKGINIKY